MTRYLTIGLLSCLLMPAQSAPGRQRNTCDRTTLDSTAFVVGSVGDRVIDTAKAILARWPHNVATTKAQVYEDDRIRDNLISDLRKLTGLSTILATLILSPDDKTLFPGALLPSVAANAYVRAGLSEDTLQRILLSRRSPFLARESIAWALAARDRENLTVSLARRNLVCALSSNVSNVSPDEAKLLAGTLWLLNAEGHFGSLDAQDLLHETEVAGAARWLETRGYHVRPGFLTNRNSKW